MVVDQEACSFRHPEQEQGGSSESISTQDSESKLIVWLYGTDSWMGNTFLPGACSIFQLMYVLIDYNE